MNRWSPWACVLVGGLFLVLLPVPIRSGGSLVYGWSVLPGGAFSMLGVLTGLGAATREWMLGLRPVSAVAATLLNAGLLTLLTVGFWAVTQFYGAG